MNFKFFRRFPIIAKNATVVFCGRHRAPVFSGRPGTRACSANLSRRNNLIKTNLSI